MTDCWNQIGVWSGRQSKCEKLQQVVHCRNCDVYTKAGKRVMQLTVPKEYLEQLSKSYSRIPPVNDKKHLSVVVFRLGSEWFCLPTTIFESVENMGFIHSIPRYSNQLLLGVVNIRGTLQLCFSLGGLLQVTPENPEYGKKIGVYKRLLVLVYNQQYYVFPVDEVGDIERIDDTNLENPPVTLSASRLGFVKGMVKTAAHEAALLNTAPLLEALEEAAVG